jgi:hypothetical protein
MKTKKIVLVFILFYECILPSIKAEMPISSPMPIDDIEASCHTIADEGKSNEEATKRRDEFFAKEIKADKIKAKKIRARNIHVSDDQNIEGSLHVDSFISAGSIRVNNTLSANAINANSANIGTLTVSELDILADIIVDGLLTASALDVLNNATISSLDVLTNATIGEELITSSLDVLNDATISSLDVLTNATVGGNLTVLGNEAITGSISACDVIVGCNLLMNNSVSPTIGNVLKNNIRFLHNTGIGNVFLGNLSGSFTVTGFGNTAVGDSTLVALTTGQNNTALGSQALTKATMASRNTAVGAFALNLVTGGDNIALGNNAGTLLTTGTGNIYLGHPGIAGTESFTIRIGTGVGSITKAFVEGIRGVTTGVNDAIPVLIDSAGQLGTVSSSRRFKNNIQDIGSVSELLMQLRPVMFNYNSDNTNQRNYGLIAEEVAQIYPELVVFDQDGNPYTVKYHLLYALLLNEIQKNHAAINDILVRLALLEAGNQS